jgi:hypothetical protein
MKIVTQKVTKHTSSNSIYGLGVIGALVYFIQTATTFWEGVVGVIYAIFWPAVVLHKVLTDLNL